MGLLGPRCNRGDGGGVGLSTCLCIHAEENALLEAGRERIREGAILYCDTYVDQLLSLGMNFRTHCVIQVPLPDLYRQDCPGRHL